MCRQGLCASQRAQPHGCQACESRLSSMVSKILAQFQIGERKSRDSDLCVANPRRAIVVVRSPITPVRVDLALVKRLAKHVPGCGPPTGSIIAVVPQHCRVLCLHPCVQVYRCTLPPFPDVVFRFESFDAAISRYAKVCTITGPANAVAGPVSRGAKFPPRST